MGRHDDYRSLPMTNQGDLSGIRQEKGASALIIAGAMVLLLGMAAIAIDLGAGFNERRQDQIAADIGSVAGALEWVVGSTSGIRDQALALTRSNLTSSYSNAEWQTIWESCMDPERTAEWNANGYLFQPVESPWTAGTPLDCISIDSRGYVRVRVPDQLTSAPFGGVIGSPSLTTHADAIAKILVRGVGGILPFGLPNSPGAGEQTCLSSAPTGLAGDPCSGSLAGNFGTLKARIFGDPEIPIPPNCTASPLGSTLAQNIAAGVDHPVVTAPSASVATEIRDQCFNVPVNTLETDVGFPNNGVEEGLVTGPIPFGFTPRLQQPHSDTPSWPAPYTQNVAGYDIDDIPLWAFLRDDLDDSPSADPADRVPTSCLKSEFDGSNTIDYYDPAGPDDFDGDGNSDSAASWQHMTICFAQYLGDSDVDGVVDSTPYSAILFVDGIEDDPSDPPEWGLIDSPRFSYVPEFWESTLGAGSSWNHIKRFRPIFLQGTWWKKGNDWAVHHPGEACSCPSNAYGMQQLSVFVVPDSALPLDLRGDPIPPSGPVNPYDVELFR